MNHNIMATNNAQQKHVHILWDILYVNSWLISFNIFKFQKAHEIIQFLPFHIEGHIKQNREKAHRQQISPVIHPCHLSELCCIPEGTFSSFLFGSSSDMVKSLPWYETLNIKFSDNDFSCGFGMTLAFVFWLEIHLQPRLAAGMTFFHLYVLFSPVLSCLSSWCVGWAARWRHYGSWMPSPCHQRGWRQGCLLTGSLRTCGAPGNTSTPSTKWARGPTCPPTTHMENMSSNSTGW